MKNHLKRSLELHDYLVENGATLSNNTLDLLDSWFRRSASQGKSLVTKRHIFVLKCLRDRTMTEEALLEQARYSSPKFEPFIVLRANELVRSGLASLVDGVYDITPAGEQVLAEKLT